MGCRGALSFFSPPLTFPVTTLSSFKSYRKTQAAIADCSVTDANENKEGSDNLLLSESFSAHQWKERDRGRKKGKRVNDAEMEGILRQEHPVLNSSFPVQILKKNSTEENVFDEISRNALRSHSE